MDAARMHFQYLFHEGSWWATGYFCDAGGERRDVRGETLVRHLPGLWISESVFSSSGARAIEHRNRIEIVPFSAGSRSSQWQSVNSTVGSLNGRFVLVEDCILSTCSSPTGRYRGFESILRVETGRYVARGSFLDEGRILSTWALDLEPTVTRSGRSARTAESSTV
jgi:hypothetical protein